MSDFPNPYAKNAAEVEINRSIITKVCLELTAMYSMAGYVANEDWGWNHRVWANAMDKADELDARTARALCVAAGTGKHWSRDDIIHEWYTDPGLSEAWLRRVALFDQEMARKDVDQVDQVDI